MTFYLAVINSEVILLKEGTVYAGSEMDRLEGHDVLIKDGFILEVGKDLDKSFGSEIDKVVSIKNSLVTPGFITPYSQLGLVEIDMIPETRDDSSSLFSAGFSISQAFNPASTLIPHNLNGGITSSITMPSSRGLFRGMASFFSLAGSLDSLIETDMALVGNFTTGAESKAANIQLMEDSITLAKDFDLSNNLEIDSYLPDGVKFSIRDWQALKKVAKKDIPLIIRADRASDIIALIKFADRVSVNLILLGASEGWMVADTISKANIPVILEPINNLPSSFDRLGSRLENAALMHKSGVNVMFKSDNFDTHNAYLSRQGAGIAVSYGLPWKEAIKALTANIAEAFNLENIGSIEPGFKADLVIWNSDPLEVTSYPKRIYIDGVEMSSSTRSKKLRDRYINLD
tara:strand:- start:585 stop:1790 length:1206 start_codon:yes stop_codon:yes gene_type:complete